MSLNYGDDLRVVSDLKITGNSDGSHQVYGYYEEDVRFVDDLKIIGKSDEQSSGIRMFLL